MPARAEDLMIKEMSISPINIEHKKTKPELGSNDSVQYVIIGGILVGILVVSIVVSYHLEKQRSKNHEEDKE